MSTTNLTKPLLMASISKLPDEITVLIAEACDVPGKASLARSSRHLGDLASQVLHRYNVQNEGSSAMYWAAEHGHINTFERMRSCGAEVNDTSGSRLPAVIRRLTPNPRPILRRTFGFSPLHVAAKFGQDAAVRWLLRNGARIESPAQELCRCTAYFREYDDYYDDDDGWDSPRVFLWTPLHLAICHKNLSTAKLLISCGAAVQSPPDHMERMPTNVLHSAARCNNAEAIEFLVGSGLVSVDEPDGCHYIALHYACTSSGNISALNMLLDLGASLDTPGHNDHRMQPSPIETACNRGFFEAALKLVTRGALHSIKRPRWNHFLQFAAEPYQVFFDRTHLDSRPVPETWEEHREDFIRRLIELGVDVDDKRFRPRTALGRISIQHRSLARTLQVFLEAGADVNALDDAKKNSICLVLEGNIFDPATAGKIKLLLQYGARLDLYSNTGHCAFDRALGIARTTGDAAVIDFIFQHSSVANFGDGFLDRVVAQSYDSRLFNECRLLNMNFHLDLFPGQIKPYGMLEMALKHYKDANEDEMTIIKNLLDRPDFGSTGNCDASRLLCIACERHLKIRVVELLLEKGGQVNRFDSDWETPLSYAVDNGCRHMVKYLLLHGADPHLAPTDQDWSAHVRTHLALAELNSQYRTSFVRAIVSLHRHSNTHDACQRGPSERVPLPLEVMLDHVPLPPISPGPYHLSYVHLALAHPASLRLLLEKGADPNSTDYCIRPPLLYFLTMPGRPPHPEAVSVLLEFGADIHPTDGEGRSFLTVMRRSTLAMVNNDADDDAELEHEKLDFAGLLVRNFFITLDAESGEDCIKPRPKAVAESSFVEYVGRLAARRARKRQLMRSTGEGGERAQKRCKAN
ncbi:hypothetical protein Daus18300_012565 [Diaporthe australafricana]|uniref:Ankyrin n=1 Tax=Diaporthe australafricana TaxID=127596 RepID=A0ABR3W2B5_9PEZI